jgi:formimidoylglutamate deiminase
MNIFAQKAYCADGWKNAVRISITDGEVETIETNSTAAAGDILVDTLLPALSNLHSHSFQRAMAGMTEYRAKGRESFWTWRALMYEFVDRLTPEHVTAFAAQTFLEMQKAGYAAVGEFHYIHNQNGGVRYDNPAELSLRIMQAAQQTGIGLTHLPVLYARGGVDDRPLEGGQLRFSNTVETFNEIVESSNAALSKLPNDARLGIAPHSLRACSHSDLNDVLQSHPKGPIHIHIAEQLQEVSDVQNTYGTTPVDWLLNNADVNSRWCLIHATHLSLNESTAFAKSGAIAGLCPITEANLGDGIFNGPDFLKANGLFGVGSDSNVNISLTEELRTLEYSQRLRDMERNVMVNGSGSTGETIYLGAAKGGAQALDRNSGQIAQGMLADLVAIDSTDPSLCALREDQLLDGLVFAAKDSVVTDVWCAGRHQVQSGRHVAEETISTAYRAALSELLA